MTDLYSIFMMLAKQESNCDGKYLSKRQVVKDIVHSMRLIFGGKQFQNIHKDSNSMVMTILQNSEELQKICEEVCCFILQNKVNNDNNAEFNYLKPEIYSHLESLSTKIENMEYEIEEVNHEIDKVENENSLSCQIDYKEYK